MGLLKKRETYEDSVYNRRLERGEINETPVAFGNSREVQELRREVRELAEENRRLKKQIEYYQDEISRSEFVHSMDDLIETMKKDAEKPSASSTFGALLNWKPSAAADGAENMLMPDAFINAAHTDISEFADENEDVDMSDMNEMDER